MVVVMKKAVNIISLIIVMIILFHCQPVFAADSLSTFCYDYGPTKALKFIGYLLFVIKIVLPLLIILIGSFDLGKAMMAKDDSAIKESTSILIKRIILGVVIFLLPTLLSIVLSMIKSFEDVQDQYKNCLTCLLKPGECKVPELPETTKNQLKVEYHFGTGPNQLDDELKSIIGNIAVEIPDWWATGKSIIPRGGYPSSYTKLSSKSTFIVYDVKSKKSFKAFRTGGTNHMDVVPASPSDTAIFKAIVGTWNWTRRAIIIYYDGKAYAASCHAMPHASGKGIPDVGFDLPRNNSYDDNSKAGTPGHFCIHMLNSRTHGKNSLDDRHQACVQKAYDIGNGYDVTKKGSGCN